MIPEIVVGWQKGELLPNYDPDIPLDLVQRLSEKVNQGAEGFPTAKEANQRIKELKEKGYQEISVSGVWTHNCVAAAIYGALCLGLNVQANEEDTFNVLGLSLEKSGKIGTYAATKIVEQRGARLDFKLEKDIKTLL